MPEVSRINIAIMNKVMNSLEEIGWLTCKTSLSS